MKILILGNGYDIACGLKTSYNDYFSYIESNNSDFFKLIYNVLEKKMIITEENLKQLLDLYDKSNLSLWNIHFYIKQVIDCHWCDIEGEIESVVNGSSKFFNTEFLWKIGLDKEYLCKYRIESMHEMKVTDNLYAIFMYKIISQKSYKIDDIKEILLEEIYRLEENFNNYLTHEGDKVLK